MAVSQGRVGAGVLVGGALLMSCGLLASERPAVVVAALAVAALIAVVAADVDRRTLKLPNQLVAGIAVVAFGAAIAGGHAGGALAGSVALTAPFLVIHLVRPAGLAFGDVKFAAACGVIVGAVWWPAASIAGAATCLALAGRRVRGEVGPLPAGPLLVLGTGVGLSAAALLVQKGVIG